MKHRILTAAVFALVALTVGAADVRLGHAEGGPPSTGRRQPVVVHRGATLPPPGQGAAVPLLIGLHASGGTPANFELVSGLDRVADEHGFVVAYLSAPIGGPAWTLVDMASNLAYVSAEIRQLITDQNIDPNRVYVTGFSAGATMSFFVGCQLSSQVAGIAVVMGAMRFSDPCKLAHPVSELFITNKVTGTSRLLSADQITALWSKLNSCSSQSTSSTSGVVTATAWSSCNDSSTVGLNVIHGGTHQWPGGPQSTGVNAQYDAAEAVWSFFAEHPGTPVTAPSAKLVSTTVQRASRKRWVRADLNATEAAITVKTTLAYRGRTIASASSTLARSPRDSVVVQIPPGAPGGRYALKLVLLDSYGRHATMSRTVTVPKLPKT